MFILLLRFSLYLSTVLIKIYHFVCVEYSVNANSNIYEPVLFANVILNCAEENHSCEKCYKHRKIR